MPVRDEEGRVNITLEFDCSFRLKEIWPDGDVPEVVTREEIMDLLKAEGLFRVASAWGFPQPQVSIGFTGFDEHGRKRHAEKLWVGNP